MLCVVRTQDTTLFPDGRWMGERTVIEPAGQWTVVKAFVCSHVRTSPAGMGKENRCKPRVRLEGLRCCRLLLVAAAVGITLYISPAFPLPSLVLRKPLYYCLIVSKQALPQWPTS